MENQNEIVLEGEYIPAGEPATFEEWLNKSSVVHPAQNLGQHAGHKFYKQEIYYG